MSCLYHLGYGLSGERILGMTLSQLVIGLAGTGAVTLFLSWILTLLARRIALRIGFVDRPSGGAHKSHREPMPYGGGISIFLSAWLPMSAMLLAAFLVSDAWVRDHFGDLARDLAGGLRDHAGQAFAILVGGMALLLLGVLDDRKPLGPLPKLLIIACVSVFVASVGRVRIAEFAHPAISIGLTVLWMIVITNAFNFLDNMDGLSAGVAAICMGFLLICGVMAGQWLVPAIAAAMLGATLGFLFHNFPPARIFMGDAGSLLLGYMLAVLSIMTSYWKSGDGGPAFALGTPLALLAIPLYDFCSVVVIRVLEGRNPLRGDQRHFSHRLVERGLSRRSAVLTIYLATATTGLAATLLPGAGLRSTITVLAIVAMTLGIIAILEAPLRKDDD